MNLSEDLKAYIDGELDPERSAEIRRALKTNPRLMQEYEELITVSHSIKAYAAEIKPHGLEATLATLENSKSRVFASRLPLIWFAGFALAMVGLVLLIVPRSRLDDASSDSPDVSARAASEFSKNAKATARSTQAPTFMSPMQHNRISSISPETANIPLRKLSMSQTHLKGSTEAKRDLRSHVWAKQPSPLSIGPVAKKDTQSNFEGQQLQADPLGPQFRSVFAEKEASTPAPQRSSLTASGGNPGAATVISVACVSLSHGLQEVLSIAGKYQVSPKEVDQRTANTTGKSPEKVLVLDIPMADVASVVDRLQRLELSRSEHDFNNKPGVGVAAGVAQVSSPKVSTRFSGAFGGGATKTNSIIRSRDEKAQIQPEGPTATMASAKGKSPNTAVQQKLTTSLPIPVKRVIVRVFEKHS